LLEQTLKMAERVRFELTSPVKGLRFSRPVHSTALPPLRYLLNQALALYFTLLESPFSTPMFPFCSSLHHQSRKSIASPLSRLRYRMRIGHKRDVHIRMPQRLRDRDDIHPFGEQVARERVAQIMESYLTDAHPAQGTMKAGAQQVRTLHRSTVCCRADQVVLALRAAGPPAL
jgi:hypothetical protein